MRRLALITDAFRAKIQRLKHTLVYKTPAYKGGRKYLSVFAVTDPQDPDDPGYFYVQRLGTNSVALIFYDADNKTHPWIVLEQFNSPIKQYVRGAFTGSLDKPDLDPIDTIVEEALEEAGFTVTRDQVHVVGFAPVSANTNEQVHLAVVDVTGVTRQAKEPENLFEANTKLIALSTERLLLTCEWKAVMTCYNFLRETDAGRAELARAAMT